MGRANPTESRIIRGKLDTLEIAVRLRVEEAKKAGYSEEEIADFLAKDNADSTNKVMVSLWKLELTVLFVATLVGIGVIILSP